MTSFVGSWVHLLASSDVRLYSLMNVDCVFVVSQEIICVSVVADFVYMYMCADVMSAQYLSWYCLAREGAVGPCDWSFDTFKTHAHVHTQSQTGSQHLGYKAFLWLVHAKGTGSHSGLAEHVCVCVSSLEFVPCADLSRRANHPIRDCLPEKQTLRSIYCFALFFKRLLCKKI